MRESSSVDHLKKFQCFSTASHRNLTMAAERMKLDFYRLSGVEREKRVFMARKKSYWMDIWDTETVRLLWNISQVCLDFTDNIAISQRKLQISDSEIRDKKIDKWGTFKKSLIWIETQIKWIYRRISIQSQVQITEWFYFRDFGQNNGILSIPLFYDFRPKTFQRGKTPYKFTILFLKRSIMLYWYEESITS